MCLGVVATCLVIGCQERQSNKKSKPEVPASNLLLPNKEHVAILSAKYGVSSSVVAEVLRAYLLRHDFFVALENEVLDNNSTNSVTDSSDSDVMTGLMNRNTIPQTLTNLSVAYEVPIGKIAAIIFDYRVWTKAAKESY
jgi:hypothetical protein